MPNILVLTSTKNSLGTTISMLSAKKANSINAFLQRNISSCPMKIKSQCYTSLVRPILEYASVVWDPLFDKQIKQIEAVQRKAARSIKGDYRKTSSVTEMIQDLQLPTLQQRRKHAKTIMMYKICINLLKWILVG